MTVALPTLASIDDELSRTRLARAACCDEIGDRLLDVAEADVLVDELLALRCRVAALPVVAGA